MTRLKKKPYLSAFAFLTIILVAHQANGQSNSQPLTFRAGQSMYIVAFRQFQLPVVLSPAETGPAQREYTNYDLDAERKVRKRKAFLTG